MSVKPAEAGFPPPHFPTVFADGVLNFANNPSVVKYFLARIEPNFGELGVYQIQPFAQVVMPLDGFVNMVCFFEEALKGMVRDGLISQARVDEHRANARAAATGS
jgi:hypothetical protein